jgi:hypothetical protein
MLKSTPHRLASYHELLGGGVGGREPAEADTVLAHGLPIALQLLGKDTKEKPSQLINLAAGKNGFWQSNTFPQSRQMARQGTSATAEVR